MNVNIVTDVQSGLRQKAKYGLTILLKPLRLDVRFTNSLVDGSLNIFYGETRPEKSKKIFFLSSSPDFQTCVSNSRLPSIEDVEWIDFSGKRIPRFFSKGREEGEDIFSFDVVAATFMLASNYQDLISTERDEYDRLRAMDSIQDRLNILNFPVVNYYSLLLKNALEKFFNIRIEQKDYSGAQSAVALTHDIDYTSSLNPKIIRRDILGHSILNYTGLTQHERTKKLLNPLAALIGRNPAKAGLSFLRETELARDVRSTFFIKSGKSGKEDVGYSIRSSTMKSFLKSLRDNGFEIGIHPSMKTYIDAGRLITEKYLLEETSGTAVSSVRQHYLKFAAGTTIDVWEQAAMKYDSTLGFSRKVGFRNSVAFPFPLFNFRLDGISAVEEIPLVFMDGTLAEDRTHSTYETFEIMTGLIREVKEAHGAAAVLFHNSLLDPIDFPGYGGIYSSLINEIKGRGMKIGTVAEIAENFR
ncbi:MAG TPA: polysaccharide deacetylase family protein [Candidatus Kryptonia bacterium]